VSGAPVDKSINSTTKEPHPVLAEAVVKSAITCGVALIGFNIAIRIRKRYISLLLCKLNRDFCKILSKISVMALGFD
jgi:hypothetical protein